SVPGRGARRAARDGARTRPVPGLPPRAALRRARLERAGGDAARRAVPRARRRAEHALVALHGPWAPRELVGGHRAADARPLPRRARAPLRRRALPDADRGPARGQPAI